MADTLQDITLPANTWVNIYTQPVIVAAGITVGTAISAQNTGQTRISANAGATQPTSTSGERVIPQTQVWSNDSGDSGAWFYSPVFDGLVNVRAE